MTSIAARPLPASTMSEPVRMGWEGAPLATTKEPLGDGPYAAPVTLVPAYRAVHHAFQPEPRADINGPLFERVGTDLREAITAARARAVQSFQELSALRVSSDGVHQGYQAQAVLQGQSGAYYLTGVDEQRRHIPFDATSGFTLDETTLHPDLRAIVGPDNWIPAPGVAEQLGS